MKEDYESKLNDIKYLNEQEQLLLKSKIRKLEEEIALLQDSQNEVEFSPFDDLENGNIKTLRFRFSQMSERMNEDVFNSEKMVLALKNENEDLLIKNKYLKDSIERIKVDLNAKISMKEKENEQLKQKYDEK